MSDRWSAALDRGRRGRIGEGRCAKRWCGGSDRFTVSDSDHSQRSCKRNNQRYSCGDGDTHQHPYTSSNEDGDTHGNTDIHRDAHIDFNADAHTDRDIYGNRYSNKNADRDRNIRGKRHGNASAGSFTRK